MTSIETILNAVKATIDGLNLTHNDQPVPVDIVKGAEHRTGIDDPVRITVAKAARPERYSRYTFAKRRIDFVVEVTVYSPHSDPVNDLPEYVTWRERIMDAFSKPPLTGAPDVFELDSQPLDFLNRATQQAQWDVQGIEITASIVKPY